MKAVQAWGGQWGLQAKEANATVKNLFLRLAGDPKAIDEPKFTQIFASVLERDEDLARSLGEWMLAQKGQSIHLSGAKVTVLDEIPIPYGGKPDLLLEFSSQGVTLASVIVENKLEATIANPLDAYVAEVVKRRNRGQKSVLVLVSRRNARTDIKLEPFWNRSEFLYLQWHEVYRWLKHEYLSKNRNASLLTEEFIEYLGGMGMAFGGMFTLGEIGLAAYYPALLAKLDAILWHEDLNRALRRLSCQDKNPVKYDWKKAEVYAHYAYVKPGTAYYVAAGFAYPAEPYWKGTFGEGPCPIVAFVGLGSETWTKPQELKNCLDWIRSLMEAKGITLDPSEWYQREEGVELAVYAYRPLTDFMARVDHQAARCAKSFQVLPSESAVPSAETSQQQEFERGDASPVSEKSLDDLWVCLKFLLERLSELEALIK